MDYPFIVIASRSILARSGSCWWDPIDGSDRTVSHLNSMQTNDLQSTELLEIELFDHSNTWNDLTVRKAISNVE